MAALKIYVYIKNYLYTLLGLCGAKHFKQGAIE